jgi:STAM-binding protein
MVFVRPSYPPPMTTTSTPAHLMGPVRYPSLMSQHQLAQGYRPSVSSVFSPHDGHSHDAAGPSTLFPVPPSQPAQYTSHPLPPPPVPSNYYPSPMSQSQTPRAPPAPPISDPAPRPERHTDSGVPREQGTRELKTVTLPRECLPRFLSIAAVNTARNRETCGLLLGKDRGHKFVVTTLLIPKQRSTSDTCAMEEEELVLQFTDERALITLGWIHTHPTQSCFMSSVDLHTHSGFQRMLPESFAVVCAPQHTPKYVCSHDSRQIEALIHLIVLESSGSQTLQACKLFWIVTQKKHSTLTPMSQFIRYAAYTR